MNYPYDRYDREEIKKEKIRTLKNVLKPFVFIYYKSDNLLYKAAARLVLGFIFAFFIFGILTLFVRLDRMKSSTMTDSINPGEFIITSKLRYAVAIKPFVSSLTGKTFIFSRPERGDVVFMIDPRSERENVVKRFFSYAIYFMTFGRINVSNTKYLVKRVVGLPTETIEIRDKVVYINGNILNETWNKVHKDFRILNSEISKRDNLGPYIIGYNQYFVLSDNRDYGYDSRDFGSVDFSLINGKVISE